MLSSTPAVPQAGVEFLDVAMPLVMSRPLDDDADGVPVEHDLAGEDIAAFLALEADELVVPDRAEQFRPLRAASHLARLSACSPAPSGGGRGCVEEPAAPLARGERAEVVIFARRTIDEIAPAASHERVFLRNRCAR